MARLIRLVLFRSIGPGKALAYLFLWRTAKRIIHSDDVTVTERLRPGQRILVEHLQITHKRQIAELKRQEKAERRARKAARKERRQPAS